MIRFRQWIGIVAALCVLLTLAHGVARAAGQDTALCCASVNGATLQGCVFIDPSVASANQCPAITAVCPTLACEGPSTTAPPSVTAAKGTVAKDCSCTGLPGGSSTGCGAGLGLCSGTCTNVQNDPNNCGSCGVACGSGGICYQGNCYSETQQKGS